MLRGSVSEDDPFELARLKERLDDTQRLLKRVDIAADMFWDDYEGLALICGHEIYHLAQAQFMPRMDSEAKEARLANTETLLIWTLVEGSATLMANPLKAKQNGPYIKWFQQKYRRNLRHLTANFALFKLLLYRAHRDEGVKEEGIYQLGFAGFFGSPLYFVGYRMADVIERHLGHSRLLKLYQTDALEFFRTYVDLCHETDNPDAITFGDATLEVIRSL